MNETQYIGLSDQFLNWALINYRYQDTTKIVIYKKRAELALKKAINDTPGWNYVYMDVWIGDDGAPSRVVFELFKDLAPKTCENFTKLCNGEFTNKHGEKIGYQYSYFHWVYKKAFVQGGVIHNKKGGKSIFDGEFPDESFEVKHVTDGLLGMCKNSEKKHSNES